MSFKNIKIGLFALLVLLPVTVAYALEQGEAAKIKYLIDSVENLQGATFIRNGSEYDSKRAAEHLRFKLKKAGSRIRTAEDFIQFGSKSYLSGKPYRIRYSDGTLINAEAFFRERLKEFPAAAQSGQ